jgi:chaperone BCS1
MPISTQTVTPSQLLRRLSTILSTDLSEGADLLEVTYILVLRNLLKNFRQCGSRAYAFLRIVVPYVVLVSGIYGATLDLKAPSTAFKAVVSYMKSPFTARIVVSANSPANRDVLAWLAAHGATKHARTLALWDKPSDCFVDEEWEETSTSDQDADDQRSAPLRYIPDFGKYSFRYQGHFMSMERKDFEYTESSSDGVKHEGLDPTTPRKLVLECFPTLQGTSPLKRFLEHVKGFSTPSKENTTTLYHAVGSPESWRGHGLIWTKGACRPARSLDSVALEHSKKDAMVKDIAYYLTPECQRFYANRGYPYRRGFLLYGPPGTGKTSFCVALAGHFNLDVYILSVSDQNMSDQQLERLFANLPDKCIVLLEDVDSAGLTREISTAEHKRRRLHNNSDYDSFNGLAEEHRTGITLSGLLNCIDGPMSKDGRIICLTSNAPDSLDPALVRPGRCDHKVLFGYTSEEISTQLFQHLYTKRPDELVGGETSVSDDHDIPSMA